MTIETALTPTAMIDAYWNDVWNACQADRLRQICHDPIVRHDPMCVANLGYEDQVVRIQKTCTESHPYFTHEVLLGDDRFACSVWNMFTRKGEKLTLSGVEVFEAKNGRFKDCWNSPYSSGYWGRTGGDTDPLTPRKPAGGFARGGSEDDAIKLVRCFFTAWANGQTDEVRTVLAEDLVRYLPGGIQMVGIDASLADLRAPERPDAAFAFDALFADRDHVCAVWSRRFGTEATDATSGIDVFRIDDNCIVEWWSPPRTLGAWGRKGDGPIATGLPAPALLATVTDIDALWIQSVFQHAGIACHRIAMIDAKPIGHGNISETVRVALGYNHPATSEPRSVICKFNSNFPAVQHHAAIFSPYRAEIETYRYFGPSPPMKMAKVYHTAYSEDGLTANIVLQDLGQFCEPGDQIAGCSVADASAVAQELARLHARFWKSPELATLPWMSINLSEAVDFAGHYRTGMAVFEDRYRDLMTDAEIDVIRAFASLVDVWRLRAHDDVTFLHSDARVDNIMFDRRGAVPEAYLIDFQAVGWGSPARDLAYFLCGSLSIEDRRSCERTIVKEHALIIAAVDPAFSEDVALRHYRLEVASGLATTISATAALADTERTRDLLTTLARRNVSAIADWKALDALIAEARP